jgi:hypothetical protein
MEAVALFLQTGPDAETVRHMVLAMFALLPVFILVGIAIVLVPCWLILKKAGFSPWLALLCLFPTLGLLVLLYVLAFAEWKVVPAPQVAWQPPQPPFPPPTSYPPYPPQQPPTPPQG